MRRTVFLVALVPVALAVGCGSTTEHSSAKTTGSPYSVRDVERAFFQAGVPFQGEVLPQSNPYLRPPAGSNLASVVALPKANSKHVQAFLVGQNSATGASEMAYVFDTKKSADEAVRAKPLSTWLESNHPVIRAQRLNVIIPAATQGNARFAQRVRRAIAALR